MTGSSASSAAGRDSALHSRCTAGRARRDRRCARRSRDGPRSNWPHGRCASCTACRARGHGARDRAVRESPAWSRVAVRRRPRHLPQLPCQSARRGVSAVAGGVTTGTADGTGGAVTCSAGATITGTGAGMVAVAGDSRAAFRRALAQWRSRPRGQQRQREGRYDCASPDPLRCISRGLKRESCDGPGGSDQPMIFTAGI